MKTKEIERLIANKIADHWYKEIHGQVAPIFGKQKLRDFTEAELKKLHIPHVVGRSKQLPCGECENYAEWDNGIRWCSVCGTKLS